MTSIILLSLLNALPTLAQIYTFPTASLFVPVEYVSNTFKAYIAASDATATTYVFSPGCEDRPCGPVTVVQGPGTAIFNETDQPITTIYNCTLSPSTSPTTASCIVSSTSPGYAFPSPVTAQFPANSGYAFPLYEAVITATGEPDIWGVDSTATRRASLFNPLTEGSTLGGGTTATTTATDASATSGSSEGVETSTTPMPSSTPATTATTMPEAASTSSTDTSASAASSTSEATQLVRSWNSLLLVSLSALLAIAFTR